MGISRADLRQYTALALHAMLEKGVSAQDAEDIRRELSRRSESAEGDTGINLNCRVPAGAEEKEQWMISELADACDPNAPEDRRRLGLEAVRLAVTLLRKNRDYGASVWDSPAFAPGVDVGASILVRLGDKVERLKTLAVAGGPCVASESFDDTLFDLAGYCLLYLARPGRGPKSCDNEMETEK